MTLGRTLVMGDIHGNLQAYQQCMERSQFDLEKDTLIQLGDVSDRHPHTAEVVEELLQIPSLVAIRGNHDSWTRNWLLSGNLDTTWLENGGYVTLKSYERNAKSIQIEEHKTFFEQTQVDYFVDSENRVFVHGGFAHQDGPQYESDSSICNWDRSLWSNALSAKQKPALLENFNEVYLGHTPTLNWYSREPMQAFNVWNLDTGAGTSGPLTIMDMESKEYWQSD